MDPARTFARSTLLLAAVGGAAISLSGCKVGPDYQRPTVESPATFRNGPDAPDAASFADLPWWQVFNDEVLQSLVREALTNNYDLRIAISRIEQAKALEAQAVSPLYPQIGYNAGLSQGRNAFVGSPSPNGGDTTSSALATLNVFWEIDLWGRIRRADEAALAQILIAEENRRGIMLSLVTSVARAYFELLDLDLETMIANENVASFQTSLDLFTRRSTGGVDSKLQVFRAQANLSQVASTIPEFQRLAAIKENQICLLLGRNPGPIARGKPFGEQAFPVEIPSGIPSALLERRPDIRAAEQSMVSANALIGVATANYFPQIGLTAFLGKVSPELSAFSSGTSNAWSVAATMAGPIFTGGRTKAEVDQAVAASNEARLRYEQTVRNAFGEVANSLVSREKLIEAEQQLKQQVSSLSSAVSMSRDRFDVGKASYFEILDAQQQLFPAQISLARTKLEQHIAVIQLYGSLGGSWNVATEKWAEAPADGAAPAPAAPAASPTPSPQPQTPRPERTTITRTRA